MKRLHKFPTRRKKMMNFSQTKKTNITNTSLLVYFCIDPTVLRAALIIVILFCISFYITLSTKYYPSPFEFLLCKKTTFSNPHNISSTSVKIPRICDNFRKGFFVRIFSFVSFFLPFYFCDFKDSMQKKKDISTGIRPT